MYCLSQRLYLGTAQLGDYVLGNTWAIATGHQLVQVKVCKNGSWSFQILKAAWKASNNGTQA